MSQVVLEYQDGSTRIFVPKSGQKLAWIHPDWLTYAWNHDIRKNNLTEKRKGTPCVFNTGLKGSALKYKSLSINPVELDEQAQLFYANILALQKYGQLYTALPDSVAFAGLFVRTPIIGKYLALLTPFQKAYIQQKFTALNGDGLAYNNKNGFGNDEDPRANYVTRENLGYPNPKMFALINGTDTHAVEEDGDYVLVHSWLEGQLPTSYGIEILDDLRISWCTIIKPTIIDSGYSVFQFPQLDGIPVPRPFITKAPVYYWRDEITIYEQPRRGLYWPEREGTP